MKYTKQKTTEKIRDSIHYSMSGLLLGVSDERERNRIFELFNNLNLKILSALSDNKTSKGPIPLPPPYPEPSKRYIAPIGW